MRRFTLEQLMRQLAGLEGAMIALWIGLAMLTITLLVLSRTRWGQQHLLRKCLILSILAHVLLMGYATTVKIVLGIRDQNPPPVMRVSLDDGDPWDPPAPEAGAPLPSPWASYHHQAPAELDPLDAERVELSADNDSPRHSQADEPGATPLSPMERVALLGPVQPEPDTPPADPAPRENVPAEGAAPVDAPLPERNDAPDSRLPEVVSERLETSETAGDNAGRRQPVGGVASALVQQPLPLPQLSHLPVEVEPDAQLAGPEDIVAAAQGRPADLNAAAAPTSEPSAADLQPSSLTAAETPAAAALFELDNLAAPSMAEVVPVDTGSPTIGPPALGQARFEQTTENVPPVYRLRVAPNRSEIAKRYGATNESEAAVHAALKWLADNQESDGRWNAARHGAGQEQRVLGRDRFGAGAQADTGISGLALLAFLASGHTHEEGLYRDNVRRGLQFLVRSQAADGNLGGKARAYAFMYCHAMATVALGEAYGMTGDRHFEGVVRRAVMYTVTAQNPTTGGWRYNVGDEGDTSQFGWQLMALRSAELAGIPIPAHTRQAAIRYLESVSFGRYGGLAAYRPVEPPSRPMTAEALACRHFLGIPPAALTAGETAQYLLAETPGEGEVNFYYWYYATLGLYQTRSEAWEQWNAALQRQLLALQRDSGDLAGSWDPNTVWGGYGGRVYTTALATLCLEIYYRFMPLYVEAAAVPRTFR